MSTQDTMTEESAHSSNDQDEDRIEQLEAQVEALAANIDALSTKLETRTQELREAEERIEELKDTATLHWEGNDATDMMVESRDGAKYPVGTVIQSKVSGIRIDDLEERLRKVEDGELDVAVRSEASEDALPIERKIALDRNGEKLPNNESRATVVFPAFGGKAQTTGGSKLVMSSRQVREVLEDRTDRAEWDNMTIGRVMRKTASLTSYEDDADNRDPESEENLITLKKRNGKLALVADRDEWLEWNKDVQGRSD